MTTPDEQDELIMLSRARAALSPSPADTLRVRHALTTALAAPAAAAPEAAVPGDGVGLAASWPLRVLMTGVAAAAIGGGGYWLGHRAGLREGRFMVSPPALAASSTGRPEIPPAATGPLAPPRERVEETATGRDGAKRRFSNGGRHAPPEASAAAKESLGQEVRALRAVERALRDNDPRLALAMLQQLDRAVPTGKLVEERLATSIIARCAAGDVPFDVNLAEQFASAYPESVYLGRVQQSCAPQSRAGGGTR